MFLTLFDPTFGPRWTCKFQDGPRDGEILSWPFGLSNLKIPDYELTSKCAEQRVAILQFARPTDPMIRIDRAYRRTFSNDLLL
jgi:hypothetical protein